MPVSISVHCSHNRAAAQRLASVVAPALGVRGGSSYECDKDAAISNHAKVMEVGAMPRQSNGFDCGVYVCAMAAAVGDWCMEGKSFDLEESKLTSWLTSEHVTRMRGDIRALIERLVASGQFAPRSS